MSPRFNKKTIKRNDKTKEIRITNSFTKPTEIIESFHQSNKKEGVNLISAYWYWGKLLIIFVNKREIEWSKWMKSATSPLHIFSCHYYIVFDRLFQIITYQHSIWEVFAAFISAGEVSEKLLFSRSADVINICSEMNDNYALTIDKCTKKLNRSVKRFLLRYLIIYYILFWCTRQICLRYNFI